MHEGTPRNSNANPMRHEPRNVCWRNVRFSTPTCPGQSHSRAVRSSLVVAGNRPSGLKALLRSDPYDGHGRHRLGSLLAVGATRGEEGSLTFNGDTTILARPGRPGGDIVQQHGWDTQIVRPSTPQNVPPSYKVSSRTRCWSAYSSDFPMSEGTFTLTRPETSYFTGGSRLSAQHFQHLSASA
jgi:hypothetical protein